MRPVRRATVRKHLSPSWLSSHATPCAPSLDPWPQSIPCRRCPLSSTAQSQLQSQSQPVAMVTAHRTVAGDSDSTRHGTRVRHGSLSFVPMLMKCAQTDCCKLSMHCRRIADLQCSLCDFDLDITTYRAMSFTDKYPYGDLVVKAL